MDLLRRGLIGAGWLEARRARVALLQGCAQRVIAPSINEATIRLLNRHGVELVIPKGNGSGCCGAIVHHLGKASDARALAIAAMRLWLRLAALRRQDRN